MNPLSQISHLLLTTAFDLYIVVLWLRFLLQLLHADYYNPIAQFVVQATAPLVTPLKRIIPGNRSWEPSVLVIIVLVKMLEMTLLGLFVSGSTIAPLPLLIFTVLSLLKLVAEFYFWTLMISVVLSWVAPGSYSPAAVLVNQIMEPLLAPCRRLLPAMGGLDLSPIFVFLGIKIFQIMVATAEAQAITLLGRF
jgi:YggT family protein